MREPALKIIVWAIEGSDFSRDEGAGAEIERLHEFEETDVVSKDGAV